MSAYNVRRINFWDNDPSVSIDVYAHDKGKNSPAVLILPGGAYFALSDREGGEVAEFFREKGFAAFVLRYSTMHPSFSETDTPINPHTVFPEPLLETAAAIRYIRQNADSLGADKNRIVLIGFSAGGHLASNYCNEWSSPYIWESLGVEAEDIRPNACVLCYAATRLHRASKTMNLAVFGPRNEYSTELLSRWCAAENINRNTPPTFLWHAATDKMVNVSQSYDMANALCEEGIIHELHVFSQGEHASGLSGGMPSEAWPELAADFIKRHT